MFGTISAIHEMLYVDVVPTTTSQDIINISTIITSNIMVNISIHG